MQTMHSSHGADSSRWHPQQPAAQFHWVPKEHASSPGARPATASSVAMVPTIHREFFRDQRLMQHCWLPGPQQRVPPSPLPLRPRHAPLMLAKRKAGAGGRSRPARENNLNEDVAMLPLQMQSFGATLHSRPSVGRGQLQIRAAESKDTSSEWQHLRVHFLPGMCSELSSALLPGPLWPAGGVQHD